MPSLPDLLDRLADDGDIAGFDAVYARAVDALDAKPVTVPMTPRRARRSVRWTAVVAIAAAAAIAVPLIVTRGNEPTTPGTTQVGVSHAPVTPEVASASAAQLAAGRWSAVATPPVQIRRTDAVLWDGREVLVLGESLALDEIALGYSPATNTWQRLPAPPLPSAIAIAVWSGREVLTWTVDSHSNYSAGAAYNPAARTWRGLAAPPEHICPLKNSGNGTTPTPSPVWLDGKAVIFGLDSASTCGPTSRLVAAEFDPVADTWNTTAVPQLLQPGDQSPDLAVGVVGGKLVANLNAVAPINTGPRGDLNLEVRVDRRLATWKPGAREWTTLPDKVRLGEPLDVDGGIAISPGRNYSGYFAAGRYILPGRGDAITRPVNTVTTMLQSQVSTGDALVITTVDRLSECPAPRCGLRQWAWDPATQKWRSLATASAGIVGSLVWTGKALVAVENAAEPQSTLQFQVLVPAAAATPPAAGLGSATVSQLQHFHWSELAASPSGPPGTDGVVAWDGSEVLSWSAFATRGSPNGISQAYDPVTNRWRQLPAPPVRPVSALGASAWTGTELVVLGYGDRYGASSTHGAAYNPTTNTWRTIAAAPLCVEDHRPLLAVGTRLLALPGSVRATSSLACTYGATAWYDPAQNRWTPGPTLPGNGEGEPATIAATRDTAVVAVTTLVGSQGPGPDQVRWTYRLAPGATAWRSVHDPFADQEGTNEPVATNEHVVMPPLTTCTKEFCEPRVPRFAPGAAVDPASAAAIRLQPEQTQVWDATVIDHVADAGAALFTLVYYGGGDVGSPIYAYAWSLQTGAPTRLPSPPHDWGGLGTAVWTGHAILLFGATHTYRFGP